MATQSVLGKKIPQRRFEGNETGFDVQDPGENVRYALNGAEAISDIIQDNINGEGKDHWSDGAMWHLTQGQQALFAFARQSTCGLHRSPEHARLRICRRPNARNLDLG